MGFFLGLPLSLRSDGACARSRVVVLVECDVRIDEQAEQADSLSPSCGQEAAEPSPPTECEIYSAAS